MSPQVHVNYRNEVSRNPEGNYLRFIDWQVCNIARVLSLDLDVTAKQEMIRVIVDWPYLGSEGLSPLQQR